MDRPKPLDSFRDFRPEVLELIRTARSRPDTVGPDRRMSLQENHLRHVAVALVAAMQSYLSDLLEIKADELGDSWDALDLVQKRYVSVQTTRRLLNLVELFPESELVEEKKIEQLHIGIQDCSGWHQTPSILARSAYREKLEGFLSDNGTRALDRAVSQFGNCGLSFFNWLSKNYPRYRGIPDLLDSLIALRNDVAHGTFNRRVTLREARVYRVAIYRLVGKIEEYQKAV
jgi:hypothetical protein